MVIDALRRVGVSVDAAAIGFEARLERLAVRLDDRRMAWFPRSEAGKALLARERRVLRLIERHCAFTVPRILCEDAEGWDVRVLTPGVAGAQRIYERLVAAPDVARRTGAAIGCMLADQHTHIPRAALEGWLPSAPFWPQAQAIENVAQVTRDVTLLQRVERTLVLHAQTRAECEDRVLVHGDLGPHNFAVDPTTEEVVGIFDYEGAAFSEREYDFRYLLLHGGDAAEPAAMLDAAIAAYEPLTGVSIDRGRVRLLNALCAIGFLGFRVGHAPDEPWCGRTLAQDLAWTRAALSAAGM